MLAPLETQRRPASPQIRTKYGKYSISLQHTRVRYYLRFIIVRAHIEVFITEYICLHGLCYRRASAPAHVAQSSLVRAACEIAAI